MERELYESNQVYTGYINKSFQIPLLGPYGCMVYKTDGQPDPFHHPDPNPCEY